MLLVLSVIDIPFESDAPSFVYDQSNVSSVVLNTNTPTLVFAKQLKRYDNRNNKNINTRGGGSSGNQFCIDKNGERAQKFVYLFLPGNVYSCQVVLTNLSSAVQRLHHCITFFR